MLHLRLKRESRTGNNPIGPNDGQFERLSKTMRNTITNSYVSTAPATSGSNKGFLARLRAALIARRQRRSLLALDDRMLADIGISRSQAYGEADRPLFDLPERHR